MVAGDGGGGPVGGGVVGDDHRGFLGEFGEAVQGAQEFRAPVVGDDDDRGPGVGHDVPPFAVSRRRAARSTMRGQGPAGAQGGGQAGERLAQGAPGVRVAAGVGGEGAGAGERACGRAAQPGGEQFVAAHDGRAVGAGAGVRVVVGGHVGAVRDAPAAGGQVVGEEGSPRRRRRAGGGSRPRRGRPMRRATAAQPRKPSTWVPGRSVAGPSGESASRSLRGPRRRWGRRGCGRRAGRAGDARRSAGRRRRERRAPTRSRRR